MSAGPRPPLAGVPREVRPYQGRRAGVVSRLLAGTVDLGVVVLVVAAGYGCLSAVLFLWSPAHFRFPATSRGVLLGTGAAVLFAYLLGSWVTTGRTYGDHLLGLRVVDRQGELLRPSTAAARSALCVLLPIGLLYALVSRANRSLQDVLLRTSVIYDWTSAAPPHSHAGPGG